MKSSPKRRSHACRVAPQVGQYATLCGEETSIVRQGYINGAVESGERAAQEVLHDLGMVRAS